MPGPSGTQSQTTLAPPGQVLLKILPFARQFPPLKFCQIFTLLFIPHVAAPRKGSAKTPPSLAVSSDSSSNVDTSVSKGEDEKDFILLDYQSDELTSSNSSDSKSEDASAENLSTGLSEKVTHVGP